MSIKTNLEHIREDIAQAARNCGREENSVKLIAVTKLHSAEEINEAIDNGVTDIGENKVQEIMDKYPKVKEGVKWHLIGHLQRNKVKYIIDKVDMIHSVDSMKLAEEIEKRCQGVNRTMDVLIQVDYTDEVTKFGALPSEAPTLIKDIKESCPSLNIRGLMTIGPFTDDEDKIRDCFRKVKDLMEKLKVDNDDLRHMDTLSMGMSGDFQIAIEEGSTAVRVGSAIFGQRDYRSEEK